MYYTTELHNIFNSCILYLSKSDAGNKDSSDSQLTIVKVCGALLAVAAAITGIILYKRRKAQNKAKRNKTQEGQGGI